MFKVKRILLLAFSLSISTAPVLARSWGEDGDCPYSKNKASKEKTEQVQHSKQ